MYIVYYHNVIATPLDAFDRKCSRIHVERFSQQMEFLAAQFNPISLKELLSQLSTGNSDNNSVVITFDDAYYGVFAHAAPVLKRLNLPATVFVVTNHVAAGRTSPLLHFDEIEIAFRLTEVDPLNLDFLAKGRISLSTERDKVVGMKSVKRKLKLLPEPQRRQFHSLLLERLGISQQQCLAYALTAEKFQTMDGDEIRALMDTGWTIGGHTRSHRTLSQLDDAELKMEVQGSFQALKSQFGLTEIPFAYPYGEAAHIGQKAPEQVQQAGYSCAVTTTPDRNRNCVNPFLLHRMTDSELFRNWKIQRETF